MNIMLIAVCVVFGICTLSGLIAGFLKKASGIISFILAGMIVSAILPSVTSWLRTSTPVYGILRSHVESAAAGLIEKTAVRNPGLENEAGGSMDDGDSSGTGEDPQVLNPDGSVNRDAVKSLLSQYGYDGSAIDYMSDEQIKNLISQYTGNVSAGFLSLRPGICLAGASMLSADLTAGEGGSDSGQSDDDSVLSALTSNMTEADRRKFIESLPIPKELQEQMETFNNSEGYARLGATDFASYITAYFASLILNIIAYFITLLIAWASIRLVIGALGIFARLPLIRTADHILGLLLGAVQGLLIIWVIFLVISLFSGTSAGKTLMDQIYASPILEALYNTNAFLKSASFAMKGIL